MRKNNVSFVLVGGDDFVEYVKNVSESLKTDVEHSVERLASKTKNVVKKSLSVSSRYEEVQDTPHVTQSGGGVLSGKLQNSLKQQNMNKGKSKELSKIHFKVGATAPHYRLMHLIEDGHLLWAWGIPTNKYTKSIPSISVGQSYAEKRVLQAFEEGVTNSFGKAKKRSRKKKG